MSTHHVEIEADSRDRRKREIPADWPNRDCSRHVATADAVWHVQRAGTGAPLLLLHGTGSSTHTWREVLPLLSAHFDVLAIDLPGHGFSSPLRGGTMRLADVAGALKRLLTVLDFVPEVVVGHSAGGAIAIELAAHSATPPQHIVGVNAALQPYGGSFAKLFTPIAKSMLLVPFLPAMIAHRARSLHHVRRMLESTGSVLDGRGVDYYQRLLTDERHVAATLRMMADWQLDSLVDDMHVIAERCCLLVGDQDLAVPPSQARAIKSRYPCVAVEELPGAGHLANEELPDMLVAKLAAFTQPGSGR